MESHQLLPSQGFLTEPKGAIAGNVMTEEQEEICVKTEEEKVPLQISSGFFTEPKGAIAGNVITEEQEEICVKTEEEKVPLQISSGGKSRQNESVGHAVISPDTKRENNDITEKAAKDLNNINPHPPLDPAHLSSHSSTQESQTSKSTDTDLCAEDLATYSKEKVEHIWQELALSY
ncbi:uncharacterized protein PAF06_006365 [Gastrophryne carolinensis]